MKSSAQVNWWSKRLFGVGVLRPTATGMSVRPARVQKLASNLGARRSVGICDGHRYGLEARIQCYKRERPRVIDIGARIRIQ